MKHKVTHSIYSEEIYQLVCIQYISLGFTHFSIALKQPRMSEDLLRQRQIQRHQEDRPVNGMETDNVLADQVEIRRPVLLNLLCALSITVVSDSGNVVCQGIQPYINHMIRVEIYRDSPFKGSSGYTKILQSRKKEIVHHLIFSGNRLDKFRMAVNVLDETVCIFTHLKEISLFLCRLYLTSAVRTFAVYKLGLCKKGLTGRTVHSFIVPFVNIAFFI